MRMRFWWSSGRNGTTIISNQVIFICLYDTLFYLLINLFVYFLLLYCYAFFLKEGWILPRHEKKKKNLLHLLVKAFHFFFPKIVSHDESSARKNKNANLSGKVILAKSDPSNHCCRIKKSFLGLQYVQELWLLWHIRFTTFKHQSWELASSTEWVSSSLSNQGRTENSSSKSLWAWNHSSLADYLNSTEKHVQICES